jgi:hypothetical protein
VFVCDCYYYYYFCCFTVPLPIPELVPVLVHVPHQQYRKWKPSRA